MNKSALVAEVAKRTDRGKADVAGILEAALEAIRESVVRGEKVTLVGFGTFERRRRNPRLARNPRQPDVTVAVPARDVPSFTPGAAFRDAVAARNRRRGGGSSRSKASPRLPRNPGSSKAAGRTQAGRTTKQ